MTGTRRFEVALRELSPRISPAFARCIARALAPREQRYGSAADLAQDLSTGGLHRLRIGASAMVSSLTRLKPPPSPAIIAVSLW